MMMMMTGNLRWGGEGRGLCRILRWKLGLSLPERLERGGWIMTFAFSGALRLQWWQSGSRVVRPELNFGFYGLATVSDA